MVQQNSISLYIKYFTRSSSTVVKPLISKKKLFKVLKKIPLILKNLTQIKWDQYKLPMHMNGEKRERGGVVVESRTPNREIMGSIPTGSTVLCP